MSKVYFYSVSDILSEENDRRSRSAAAAAAAERAGYCSRGEADHVSVLDCHRAHALLASLAAQDLGRESRECYNRSWNELSDL